jgi:FHA domain
MTPQSRRRVRFLTLALPVAGLALAGLARGAPPALTVAAPEADAEHGEIAALVGATRPDGTAARLADVKLLLDDAEAGASIGDDAVGDYSGDHPKWTPPIAIGVVYLWAKGGPETVLDGLEALFKRVPGRVSVYPTPYGQGYRPVITRVTAARAAGGDLADIPPLVGDQYKLVEAVRFNAAKLEQDESPIKHLVIITDGRDFVEHDERAFGALGDELRKKKLHVEIVWVRPPVDSVTAAANVRDLTEAARARQLSADTPGDLPALTESLADSVAGLRRYRFALAWSARAFGGSKRVGVTATVDGASASGQDGNVRLPGSGAVVFGVVLGAVAVVAAAGLAVFALRRGRGGKLDGLLEELQQIVRLGRPADEAVADLSQRFPEDVHRLATLDLGKLDPAKYRYLRTRAGQARIKEIQKQLEDSDAEPVVDDEVANILSGAMTKGQGAKDVARQIRARVGDDRVGALSRAGSQNLKDSLARVAKDHAPLKASRAADFAAEVQEALRTAGGPPLAVGWFARATGPGKRGQTLPLPGGRVIVGRSADCQLRIADDQQLADRHAEIREADGEFLIRPLDGRVAVEDQDLQGEQPLVDGAVVTLGACRYVFKCVVAR